VFLIDSIGLDPQSAVTLYIYRVGKTYPARNLVYRSKSIKNSNYSRIPPRPVGPTGQTGRAPAGSATAPDRPDRLVRPVDANFGCQQGVVMDHGPIGLFTIQLNSYTYLAQKLYNPAPFRAWPLDYLG